MSIVSTNWLDKNLENVKIIDCSWHMPNVDRDPFKEYQTQHIKFVDNPEGTDKDFPLCFTRGRQLHRLFLSEFA